MHISSISLRNYRNFKAAKLNFQSGINTVIGENGSGKTNLFQAIRILLDDSLPRYINFYPNDFNRSIGDWSGHWIIITLFFDNLDLNEEAQALAVHSSGHMDTEKEGSYSVYFRPEYQFRKELYEYSQDSNKCEEGLRSLLNKITIDDYEAVYLGRGEGDFSDDETYRKYVGDFENIDFPNPDNTDQAIFGTYLPRDINLHNEVSCTFIKALRDVESDLRSYKNNPLIRLLRGKEKTVEVQKQDQLINSIDSLNDQISSLDEVKEIREGIDLSIKEAVGTTYAPNIDIKSELPNEMEKLFQSLRLWAGDPDEEGYKGKLWELSLGGTNLIYLSLKLLEYEKVKSDKIANLLLIEEPESHIHTHIQKTLFENLDGKRTQIIISTHSTHISSVSKISSVNVLNRKNNEASIFEPSLNLSHKKVSRIERYLDAVRSNLLFAKGVVLVEGDTEQILIPEMFKKVFGLSLDEIGVSLINIGSTGFENLATLFHKDRVQKECSILTDLDDSIIKLPDDPSKDNKEQKKFRNSQKKGKERKIRLTEFSKDNPYVEVFYADYTFEVDFLMNDNSFEYKNCLNEIYKTKKFIEKSKLRLDSSSLEVAGTEVLRLANKCGKGWLALLLAENLVYNTFIPQYILEAIAFSASHINQSSKIKAIRHRINGITGNEKDNYYKEANEFDISKKSQKELLNDYSKIFKEDQLTYFLGLL